MDCSAKIRSWPKRVVVSGQKTLSQASSAARMWTWPSKEVKKVRAVMGQWTKDCFMCLMAFGLQPVSYRVGRGL
jgi:hypothetical protein